MSKFEEFIITVLLQFPFLLLVIFFFHRLDQLSSLCISMYIVESVRPLITLFGFSGIRMTWIKNQVSLMVVSKLSSPMRDTYFLFSFHKDFRISPYVPILQLSGTPYPMLYWLQTYNGIPVFLIPPNLNTMHGLMPFFINKNLNLVDPLICMRNMLTRILSKILRFTTLLLIPIINTMTTSLIVVLAIPIPFNIMSTILSRLKPFKYHNVMFNLNKVTAIHSAPSLVGFLMESLSKRSWTPHSMPVFQWVPF